MRDEGYSENEVACRRDAAILRALTIPADQKRSSQGGKAQMDGTREVDETGRKRKHPAGTGGQGGPDRMLTMEVETLDPAP
jgi:hypothetical protein